jgi:hypothetical protein
MFDPRNLQPDEVNVGLTKLNKVGVECFLFETE